MLKKSFVAAIPLAVVTALTVAPSAGSAPLANATLQSASAVFFSDAVGDSGAAPDITDVDVGNDVVLGPIVFWVTLANRPDGLTGDDALTVYLNTDRNPATGDAGSDFAVTLDADSVGAYRWDGAQYAAIDAPSLSARFSKPDEAVRIGIHPNHLGGVTAFEFLIESELGDAFDDAPNGPPEWPYTLSAGPLQLAVIGSAVVPKRPTAGKVFAAAIQVGRRDINEVLELGKVGCTLRVGTRSLRATGSGIREGLAVCSWRLPKSAKGKLVRASVSLKYGGVTAKRTFTVRAR